MIVWTAAVLMATAAAACGDSPQSMTGTAPSALASAATASDDGATFGLLKNDKDKGHGPGKGDATTPTTPTPPTIGTTPDTDADEDGPGHHATQIEGIATEVTGDCPELTILIKGQEHDVTTDATTDFQRASCEQITDGARLHIAGHMDGASFVATYVRLQGPKPAADEDEPTTTP